MSEVRGVYFKSSIQFSTDASAMSFGRPHLPLTLVYSDAVH